MSPSPAHPAGGAAPASAETWLALIAELARDPVPLAAESPQRRADRQRAQAGLLALRAASDCGPVRPANLGLVKSWAILAPVLARCWLDSGSLLGPARDGQAMAWDSDIDFGLWSDDLPDLLALCDELAGRGFKVTRRAYRGHLYGVTIKLPKVRPLHVHVFFRHGDLAVSPQLLSLHERRPAAAMAPFRNRPLTRNALQLLRAATQRRSLPGRVLGRLVRPVWRAYLRHRNTLPREVWPITWPYEALYAFGTWRIPARHFDTLARLTIDGLPFPVPADHEGYLTLRYGDWRRPRPDWCYWTDDGCITPRPPEDCGLGALFAPDPGP